MSFPSVSAYGFSGPDFGSAFLMHEWNEDAAQQATANSAEAAYKQQEFQREMANTQWQRGVADMKAAGLNPMLAYSQGPASAPSGAGYPSMQAHPVSMGSISGSESFQTASQVGLTEAETDVASATAAERRQHTANLVEEMVRTMAEVDRIAVQNELTRAETIHVKQLALNAALTNTKIVAETGKIKVDTLLAELEVPHAKNMAAAEESWFKREISPYLRDVGAAAGAAAAGVGAYVGARGGRGSAPSKTIGEKLRNPFKR